ncbi:6-phosphogluconolactonase [Marinobacterium nitratireducens]|uniref:6-phosphogluconolactonase n=1 Tax=Marinobacterium nitratireducens TaxID=518897 RepID=A0A917ZMM1_9GAMM|nr:6-phosphogluconolactonase [Marinobacterium nitratireducens]GGO85693.1 6-phosphogluconolactonase [Marinobacterium nitratireducens]
MSTTELVLPAQVRLQRFDNADRLCDALAEHLASLIRTAVDARNEAALALSGGRTPLPLFERLRQQPLPWQQVTLTLADDRWVDTDSPDSNEGLVRRHLLQDRAASARFIGLWQPAGSAREAEASCARRLAALPEQLDVVILGMGNDGHTASLFPCAQDLGRALGTSQPCCALTPTSAPHERMTLSAQRLLASRERILHLKGEDKLETLQRALAGDDIDAMPIRLFLQRPLTIYWSP